MSCTNLSVKKANGDNETQKLGLDTFILTKTSNGLTPRLRKALDYILKCWSALLHCLGDGRKN
ncbi:MAG: hypothetical protein ACRDAJ_11995 [Serratia fonticola]